MSPGIYYCVLCAYFTTACYFLFSCEKSRITFSIGVEYTCAYYSQPPFVQTIALSRIFLGNEEENMKQISWPSHHTHVIRSSHHFNFIWRVLSDHPLLKVFICRLILFSHDIYLPHQQCCGVANDQPCHTGDTK